MKVVVVAVMRWYNKIMNGDEGAYQLMLFLRNGCHNTSTVVRSYITKKEGCSGSCKLRQDNKIINEDEGAYRLMLFLGNGCHNTSIVVGVPSPSMKFVAGSCNEMKH